MVRRASPFFFLALVFLACGSQTVPGDGGAPDATADGAKPDGGIDCSRVGCAAPPPCGQPCTAICGCCFDPSCIDSGAGDARAE